MCSAFFTVKVAFFRVSFFENPTSESIRALRTKLAAKKKNLSASTAIIRPSISILLPAAVSQIKQTGMPVEEV